MATSDKRVRLTFYGGANEVGGNKILLEDFGYDIKLFLDFGANEGKLIKFKRQHGNPSTIKDLTREYLLPPETAVPIINLYTTNFILNEGESHTQKKKALIGKKDPPVEGLHGIFISHAHKDHVYGLSFLNRNIPIYAGVFTKQIIVADSLSRGQHFENFIHGLNWQTFRSIYKEGEPGLKIKEMEIFPVHVDHSIPAAYGFIFCTSAGLVVYSGDFRMHGPLKAMTYDLLKKVQSLIEDKNYPNEVLALICEGTFIQKGSIESEDRVKNQLKDLLEDMPFDYLISQYNPYDWDRFRTFVEVTKEIGWKYIIPEREAFFYSVLNKDSKHEGTMGNPNILETEHILVLKQQGADLSLYPWQKKIRSEFKKANQYNTRIKNDLNDIDSKFILFYRALHKPYEDTLPLDKIGAFLSSDIDIYAEEEYDNSKQMLSDLRKLGLPAYRILASGHAKPHDIYNYVKVINPKNLLPIHTTHPELFEKLFKNMDINIILPKNETKVSNIILEGT